MIAEQARHARDLLTRPDNTVSSIARPLGVGRAAICKYVPEFASGIRPAAQAASGNCSSTASVSAEERVTGTTGVTLPGQRGHRSAAGKSGFPGRPECLSPRTAGIAAGESDADRLGPALVAEN